MFNLGETSPKPPLRFSSAALRASVASLPTKLACSTWGKPPQAPSPVFAARRFARRFVGLFAGFGRSDAASESSTSSTLPAARVAGPAEDRSAKDWYRLSGSAVLPRRDPRRSRFGYSRPPWRRAAHRVLLYRDPSIFCDRWIRNTIRNVTTVVPVLITSATCQKWKKRAGDPPDEDDSRRHEEGRRAPRPVRDRLSKPFAKSVMLVPAGRLAFNGIHTRERGSNSHAATGKKAATPGSPGTPVDGEEAAGRCRPYFSGSAATTSPPAVCVR